MSLPSYTSLPPSAEKEAALLTDDPQVKAPLTTAHLPLLLLSVKLSPEAVAVNVAQVPETYHFPPEMIQPSWLPEVRTFKLPLPLTAPPVEVEVGAEPVEVAVLEVAVVVGEEPPPPPELLGRYLIPVLGQVDAEPTGSEGSKVPVWTDPLTLKKYHISDNAPLEHPR